MSTASLLLSAITYFSTPGANLVGASLVVTSVFTIGGILVAVLIYSYIDGNKVVFNDFQKKCLVASAAITLLWIVVRYVFGGTGRLPFALTQVLMIISYSMLIKKHLRGRGHDESMVLWWCVFIASVVAIYTAYEKPTDLSLWLSMPMWYAVRSTVMCAILIAVLYRAQSRKSL